MSLPRRLLLGAALGTPFVARAQAEWPQRPVRWVVAFAAGGAADTAARSAAAKAQEIIGQSIVIENRTGGNAVIAAQAVLQSPPDGYSFLVDAANQLTNPLLMRDLGFDYRTAFAPVTQIASFPQVIAVKHDFPAKTIAEFIAMAKAAPNTISYGTPPAAGMAHLAGELFQRLAGIRLVHAPYRGGADAARDIAAGVLDAVLITTSSIRPPVQAGRARVLAVTSPQRTAAFPDVPTLAESGFPGYDMNDWNGLFASSAVPQAIVLKMSAAVAEACRDPATRARMDPLGAEMVGSTPEGFATWMEAQRPVVARVVRDAGITLG
ncbi:tripartite tricarboxylate transporter substrate-binding protein [Paeniroseomonas aquatica]|uniref:Tripartite tricarboxylate transporter substrate-binding protein n=1 Tax=Paeniroseomonas aquatica TaxID=373043 RepID=A0ABT8A9L0_9PROT|nr:tripartite tricarboxylate transporter substrate-binding protein [Paeniroseomonas aquatica]MDN3566385.1 tripartite tricarboxylate transporter substrate-binding protein [Paeniroseomonas aquatica]